MQRGLAKRILSFYSSARFTWWWRREMPRRAARLARLIERLKPDVVHSLEIQHAGYLTQMARGYVKEGFPLWVATNWGADIHYFGRMPQHAVKIRAVLGACDYYSCETQRDVQLARDFGFRGKVLPVLPNTGGFDLAKTEALRQPGPTSARRVVLLKGPQGWVYRGLVGLQALALCVDVLKGYTVAIYLAAPEMVEAAEAFSRETGLHVEVIPFCSHEDMLRWHGRARVSIGLAISDGISTSFLEALVMGSFPVLSHTGGAWEWISDGETGSLVPPEDRIAVSKAIRRALTDDDLVDHAAEANRETARKRLDYEQVRSRAIGMYEEVLRSRGGPSHGPKGDTAGGRLFVRNP